MKVGCVLSVLLLAAVLAGCGLEQIAAQQRAAELKQQAQLAEDDCHARFPTENRTNVVAEMQCLNNATSIYLPALGSNADLVQAYMAYRMSIAEQYQNGQITQAQGLAMIREKWSQFLSEAQHRNAVAQSVAAQQQAAAAAEWQAFGQAVAAANQAYAAGLAASQPVRLQTTCMRFGNMVTCN